MRPRRSATILLTAGLVLTASAAFTQQAPATGLIVGQVVDGVSGRPLAGAIVSISGTASAAGRPQILTRGDGRFVFGHLAAGMYSITATRHGYTDGSLGRTRPGGPSRPLQLAAGERVGDASIPLWRTAAISGPIVDESGERQVDAVVKVFRRTLVAGHRQFHQAGSARSDDRGMFRVGGLSPGRYIVGTVPVYVSLPATTEAWLRVAGGGRSGSPIRVGDAVLALEPGVALPPSPAGQQFIYPPTYHPFAPASAGASEITLEPGAEYENADLRYTPVTSVPVSGSLLGPDGVISSGSLRLVPEGAHALSLENDWLSAAVDRGGRFVFAGVPPGQYAVRFTQPQIRPTSPTTQERDVLWAEVPLSVGKEPIENLAVVAQTGLRIRGQAEFDGAGDIAAALGRVSISIEPVDPNPNVPVAASTIRVDSSGQFQSGGLPGGRYYVRVANSPGGWMFAGATLEGRDVTDVPLQLSGDTAGVSVRFSDRWSGVNGSVTGAKGPDPSALVVVFPTDITMWGTSGANPRRTRSMRTNAAGGFSITLPPGDYYVAALRDDIADDWRDPELLSTISRGATRVAIRDGEQRTLQLRTRTVQ
jgi:hypothetical protein